MLLSDGFMGEPFETEIESAQAWRTSVAHDAKYLDLAETGQFYSQKSISVCIYVYFRIEM